ncbi:hydroxyacylglutathione hydrolase, partial [Escherichia coli]|nr:hydroxyacylglutathione hydrolase [Escherichia coli]
YRKVKELLVKNQITLPVSLKNERKINVFVRTENIELINVINEETLLQQPEERFAWLRSKKDRF